MEATARVDRTLAPCRAAAPMTVSAPRPKCASRTARGMVPNQAWSSLRPWPSGAGTSIAAIGPRSRTRSRTACAYSGLAFEKASKPRGRSAVFVHTESEERPCFDRDDTSFVRPLLRELAAAINSSVEKRRRIRAEPREEGLIMRGDKDIDEIELDQPQAADDTPDVAGSDRAFGPWACETLARQGQCGALRPTKAGLDVATRVSTGVGASGCAWSAFRSHRVSSAC